MLSTGQVVPLRIEKPAAGGRMIARHEGQVVLVADAIPGERVSARVERLAKQVAYAQTLVVEEPSPDRRAAADPSCGGCLYARIAYPRQLVLKAEVVADAFARLGRLNLPAPVTVRPSIEDGYRMRARLHLRGSELGFFRENSHQVCDARTTRQLLPATCDVLDRLGAGLRSLGVTVAEIEVSENVDATERAVFIDADPPVDARVLERLAGLEGLTGLAAPSGSFGTTSVTDRLDIAGQTVALTRDVRAFFQGNRYLLRDLTAHVVAQVPAGGHLLDLYAGAGLFAVAAARTRGAAVIAVEGDAIAAADLQRNAAAAGGVRAVHQAVERFVASAPPAATFPAANGVRTGGVGTVIVDPPRTGLSREALQGVMHLGASRIIVVSCDIATLARDARRLVDAGFELARLEAFDLFPNTPHVETVAVFEGR